MEGKTEINYQYFLGDDFRTRKQVSDQVWLFIAFANRRVEVFNGKQGTVNHKTMSSRKVYHCFHNLFKRDSKDDLESDEWDQNEDQKENDCKSADKETAADTTAFVLLKMKMGSEKCNQSIGCLIGSSLVINRLPANQVRNVIN